MLESLVPVYYSDAWEDCHLRDRHNAIQMGLQQAKESIDDTIKLAVRNVSYFECIGPIISSNCSFPCISKEEKALSQILDVWIEKENELTIYILLDNERFLHIKSHGKVDTVS